MASKISNITCIECEEDRERVLREIESLSDFDPDSPEGEQRDTLLLMVSAYERKGKPGVTDGDDKGGMSGKERR